jgi:hypothetical protein
MALRLTKVPRQKVHLENKRGKGYSRFRPQEGLRRTRILWEHLSDRFAQSYSRCDAARRYGVQSCPKGMTDPGQVVQYVFNTTEVEWRDVSLDI